MTATFVYNGVSATCTSASCPITVYVSQWSQLSKNVGYSGNTATATFTMGCTVLGVTVPYGPYTITLSCDKDGNLS